MTATLLLHLIGYFPLLGEIVYCLLSAAISAMHSVVQRCWIEAKSAHRNVRCHYFSIKNHVFRASRIFTLLLTSGPPAIIRLIVTINIWEPVQRMTGRFFPHISKEIIENLPSFADRNTPSTIVRITSAFPICASSNHTCPATVCRGIGHSMPTARLPRLPIILQKTSTGFSVPALQRMLGYEYLISTFAERLRNVIKTISSFWCGFGGANDSQPPKNFSNFNWFSRRHMSLELFV